jgi:hypothetical protein
MAIIIQQFRFTFGSSTHIDNGSVDAIDDVPSKRFIISVGDSHVHLLSYEEADDG